eukprot:TRINITY_DN80521_c0_g1_i4.p2 TRINITY_DN80521_c0_g1~~TRINITY_DN80521_c0_g1_i4.p2  ORF type:complete len:541 (-),score=114.94 TRINITY_DN80521_c0_g1_i4:157-1779(-)
MAAADVAAEVPVEAAVPTMLVAPAVAPSVPPVQNASLYVGDLDKDVTESNLFELFQEIGPIHSIRVCRDTITRRSLGYAYVNYNSEMDPAAARTAMEQLNYRELNGKPIRIMWANGNPQHRRNNGCNIFIKNLEKNIMTKELHNTLEDFGTILSCKVALDNEGKSKGYAFAHFESPESAQKAIDALNGRTVGESDKPVTACLFVSRAERGAAAQRYQNLYVKNLPSTVNTAEALEQLFSQFGKITSAVLRTHEMNARDGNRIKKFYGFVNFETHEAAVKAKEAMNDKEVDGSKLYVDRAQKKAERDELLSNAFYQKRQERLNETKGKNLYVKNLPKDWTDEDLRKEFSRFGDMSSVRVMKDENGESKQFGFVCFLEEKSANEALKASKKEHGGIMARDKPLYVAHHVSKAVRESQKAEQQRMHAMNGYNMNGFPAGGRGMGMAGPMPMGPNGFPMGFMPNLMMGGGNRGNMPQGMNHSMMNMAMMGMGGMMPGGGRGNMAMMNPMMHPMAMNAMNGNMAMMGQGGRGRGRGGRVGRGAPV